MRRARTICEVERMTEVGASGARAARPAEARAARRARAVRSTKTPTAACASASSPRIFVATRWRKCSSRCSSTSTARSSRSHSTRDAATRDDDDVTAQFQKFAQGWRSTGGAHRHPARPAHPRGPHRHPDRPDRPRRRQPHARLRAAARPGADHAARLPVHDRPLRDRLPRQRRASPIRPAASSDSLHSEKLFVSRARRSAFALGAHAAAHRNAPRARADHLRLRRRRRAPVRRRRSRRGRS